MDTKDDTPIEPIDPDNVLQFEDIVVRQGVSKRKRCLHRQLTYDSRERRVYCEDCHQTIESFDAFLLLISRYNLVTGNLRKKKEELEKTIEKNIHHISAYKLEKIWEKGVLLPTCPSCKTGILPEDIMNADYVGRNYELARRRKQEPFEK